MRPQDSAYSLSRDLFVFVTAFLLLCATSAQYRPCLHRNQPASLHIDDGARRLPHTISRTPPVTTKHELVYDHQLPYITLQEAKQNARQARRRCLANTRLGFGHSMCCALLCNQDGRRIGCRIPSCPCLCLSGMDIMFMVSRVILLHLDCGQIS